MELIGTQTAGRRSTIPRRLLARGGRVPRGGTSAPSHSITWPAEGGAERKPAGGSEIDAFTGTRPPSTPALWLLQNSPAGPVVRLPPPAYKALEGTPISAPSDPPKDRFCQRYRRPADRTSARVHRARASPRRCRGRDQYLSIAGQQNETRGETPRR